MDIIPQRPCNKCGQSFPRTPEYWHKDKTLSEGLRYICKTCANDRAKDWHNDNIDYAHKQARQRYQDNIDERRAQAREYYWQDPDKSRQQKRDDYQRHRLERDAYNREWAARNPERIKAIKKAYVQRDPKRRKKQALAWRNRNLAYSNRAAKNWRRNNPEKTRVHRAARRARELAAEGSFTADDIHLQYRAQRGNCWHCGKPVGDDYHVDHLRPLAKDGTNDPRNLVISCEPCNLSKGSKQTWEWNGRLF